MLLGYLGQQISLYIHFFHNHDYIILLKDSRLEKINY